MAYSEPGLFNVLDPWLTGTSRGMLAGPVSAADAELNAQILQAAITAAQAAQSGCPSSPPDYAATILFPGHSVIPLPVGSGGTDDGAAYLVAVPVGQTVAAAIMIECNWPLLFLGTGNIKLVMVANTANEWGDMFFVQSGTGMNEDLPGMTFENLDFHFGETTTSYAAIHVAAITTGGSNDGAQNVRVVCCAFDDCPTAVWFEQSLQCSMLECTAYYTKNNGTCVIIGNGASLNDKASGKEIWIAFCDFYGSAGGTGLQIRGSEHTRVVNSRIDGFSQGIQIVPGSYGKNALRCFFSDVSVYVAPTPDGPLGTALLIQPQSINQQIGQIVFESCAFEPTDSATSMEGGGAGIIVDPNGSVIDTVRFVSCYSCRWPGPGMLIKGGNNLEVLGGMYAGNNLGSGTGPFAGIAIIGAATGVRIIGASCVGKYSYVTIGNDMSSPHQSYGVYVDQGATEVLIDACDVRENSQNGIYINGESGAVTTDVFVRGCNATGYSSYSAAVSVNGTVLNVQVTNSAGYNDQTVGVTSSAPASGVRFNGTAYGYYGPTTFYVIGTGITAIKVASSPTATGISTGLLSGAFRLDPGEWGEIDKGVGIVSFVLVGT
jgi:hypothetical protein